MSRWKTLTHNGVVFQNDYIPTNIKVEYNDSLISLTPILEEALIWYIKAEMHHTDKVFIKNFTNEFKRLIKQEKVTKLDSLKSLQEINYTYLKDHLPQPLKYNTDLKYMTGYIDNEEIEILNYKVEPPGIFIGRGDHPKKGMLKSKLTKKDVLLNTSSKMAGYNTINDNSSIWFASWKNNITNKMKYLWFSHNTKFKEESDKEKFKIANIIITKMKQINEENLNNLKSNPKLAAAFYLIYTFSIRIGNKKTKDEAETMGVLGLNHKNIIMLPNYNIRLKFIGKDSIPYNMVKKVNSDIYDELMTLHKTPKIFDKINPISLNEYISTFGPYTSKLFRTANATKIFNYYLQHPRPSMATSKEIFKYANLQVAIELNHKQGDKYSLSTSLLNYIDPKSILNFAKKHDKTFQYYTTKQIATRYNWVK